MKIYIFWQNMLNRIIKTDLLGESAQRAVFIFFTVVLCLSFFVAEFLFIEPKIYEATQNQGTAIIEFFSKYIRNNLLSGYREGLNYEASVLVSTGQCKEVKIRSEERRVGE